MSESMSSAPITNGAFVFFDVKPASHQRLKDYLDRINIGNFCPPPLSVTTSLKRAMLEYARARKRENQTRQTPRGEKMKRDKMVQRHASADKFGFEVVDVERGESENVYVHDFSAKIIFDADSEGVITGERVSITGGYANSSFIQSQYNAHRQTVSGSAIGKFLVRMIKELHGTCVRTMGGTYYIPEAMAPLWEKVVAAVEAASDTRITCARIVLDRNSIRAVKAAIQKEIKDEITKLEEAIASEKLGVRGLENKGERANDLLAKVQEYEAIVGEEMTAVRNLLSRVEQQAVAAIAKKQAVEQYDDLLTI